MDQNEFINTLNELVKRIKILNDTEFKLQEELRIHTEALEKNTQVTQNLQNYFQSYMKDEEGFNKIARIAKFFFKP